MTRNWPGLATLVVFAGFFGLTYRACVQAVGGHFAYVLDDAYIHMAVARNLAEHGVWGVTPYEFTSVSSSILWVAFLAIVYGVAGVREWVPLAMNFAAAALTILVLQLMIRAAGLTPLRTFVLLLALTFLACLLPFSFTGLEHVAHIGASLWFAHRATAALQDGRAAFQRRQLLELAAAALLLTGLRYESALLVGVVAVLVALRLGVGRAVVLAAAAALPIAIVGSVAITQGEHFLPNSILLKSGRPEASLPALAAWLLTGSYRALVAAPKIAYVVIGCLVVFVARSRQQPFWDRGQLLLSITTLTAFVHMQFSTLSWFMRYEAYLITLGLVSLVIAGADFLATAPARWRRRDVWPAAVASVLLALFGLLPLGNRAAGSWRAVPLASRNIHEQQYQMGLFCRSFYGERVVAANDIGAICFLVDLHCVDIWGLATREVCDAKLAAARGGPPLDLRWFDSMLRAAGVDMLVAYDRELAKYGDPDRDFPWLRVGSWTIADNVVCAQDRVTFYAPDSTRAAELQRNLARFAARLPDTVQQEGTYPITASTVDPTRIPVLPHLPRRSANESLADPNR